MIDETIVLDSSDPLTLQQHSTFEERSNLEGSNREPTNPWKLCHGIVPLRAKLATWHKRLLKAPDQLHSLLATHGSPVHLHRPQILFQNLTRLGQAVEPFEVDLDIFFARKANKCLSYARVALAAGFGLDVASAKELEQALRMRSDLGPERSWLGSSRAHGRLPHRCILHGIGVDPPPQAPFPFRRPGW